MRIVGVLPVKCFSRGKSRLASVLDAEARSALARALFTHVLSVATASRLFDALVVVTDGDDAASVAAAYGATHIGDPPARSLGEIVDGAIRGSVLGAEAVVVLMGDLPTLCVDDLRSLARRLSESDLVIAPDSRDEGTNALAIRVGAFTHTEFGHSDSFSRHLALGAGLRVAVYRSEGLGFDVDTPIDLERWRGVTAA
jgi:2-phospho-L-lactate guanylyltransferase